MSSQNGAPSTSNKHKRKVVGVVLLSGEELIIHVDVKGKFYEVFNQVAAHLSLRETEYFGLALLKDDEFQFLILDEKISKIAPKKWKTSPGEGWDSDGSTPLFTVWFRVQFYVDQVVLLREKVTRHLYYLQLKENVLKYNHLYNEEKCFQIVGYALQADHGNFIADKHSAGYFDPRHYFPEWMVEKRGVDYLGSNSPLVHHDLHNMTRTDAELKYVRECSALPGAHNLHFYRARMKKSDKACNAWLAICYRGVEVYEDDAGFKNLISTFLWQDIGRIVFDSQNRVHVTVLRLKKKFEIRSAESAGGRRFAYYTENDGTSKYLLHICRSTHMFQMAIQPKLMEIRHLDAEDRKRYKESYIYSDARDLHANGGPVRYRSSKSPGKSPAGTQRYSVISDVSSNTTSGIVSDRMATSFEEGEGEPAREIIIDCPPRQNSLHGALARVPPRGSYKVTPPTTGSRSPALPPQSLELFRSTGSSGKGSPASPHMQDLSPASSNGSCRAKLPRSTYSSMGKSYTLSTPSPSSPGQPYNLVANPSPSSPCERGELPSVGRSASRKESFKVLQAPMLLNVDRNTSGDSTTTSGSTASTGIVVLSVENSPVPQPPRGAQALPQHSSSSSSSATRSPSFTYPTNSFAAAALGGGFVFQPETLASPQTGAVMMTVPAVTHLDVPSTSPPLLHLPSPQTPHPPLPPVEHLYTDRSRAEEMQEVLPPPLAFADSVKVNANLPAERGHGYPSHSSHSSGAVSSSSSFTQSGGVGGGGGSSMDSGHVLSDESGSAHHSAQSSEEDLGAKESHSDSSTPRKTATGKRNTPAKVKAGSRNKATHVSVKNQKEALHPDIEQILGQSQAGSLPFMMALCNDLMTGSTHSSAGSDTATLRSSDSHPDSRRWSTCGPGETSMGADSGTSLKGVVGAAGVGIRPFSWHSEHFDLNATLSTMPSPPGRVAARPQQPQPAAPLDNHHSFPHDLYAASSAGHSVLWTQAIVNSGGSVPYTLDRYSANSGGSVPYTLDRFSPELIAQQLMIPSRLSSGGHSVSDTGSIGHHKVLKENVGIA